MAHRSWLMAHGSRTLVPCALLLAVFPLQIRAEEESSEARRERLNNMTAAEKEELRLKKERFDRLSDEEKASLRRVHERICRDPESKTLREIMIRYNDWLKSLPSSKRAELLNLSADERIAEIKRLVEKQDKERFNDLVKKTLRPEDYEAMIRWFEDRVLSRLPLRLRAQIASINDPRRRRFEMFRLYRQRTGNRPLFEANPLTAPEIQLLTDQLSSKAREALGKAENAESHNRIVRDWIGAG
ncbi:MAG: hypothetical protein ACC628_05530, partial [Pirellulaceae bacterium]